MNSRNVLYLVGFVLLLGSCARPIAKFDLDRKHKSAPSEVVFKNESKKAESYVWDFGDGKTSQEENPTHKYLHSGNYTITLIAKKGNKTHKMEKEMHVNAPENCLLEMETSAGTITIRLYDNTPQHRDNFIKLAEEGYFDDLLFHRIIKGFMIQGGDPESRGADANKRLGMGGPGYQVPAEINSSNFHVKGALSAARMGDAVNPEKKSSGSQFYIVQGKPVIENELQVMESRKGIVYPEDVRKVYKTAGGTPFLDQEYTVFGIVERGLDIVDEIAGVATGAADRPIEDVKILKVRVVR